MGRLNYTRQRKSFHCELKRCCGPLGLSRSGLGAPVPGLPQGGVAVVGARAPDEQQAGGLMFTKQQPLKGELGCWQVLCSAFSRLLWLSWKCEECGLRALGN